MMALLRALRSFIVLAKIEAGSAARAQGPNLLLMAGLAGCLSWGVAQIEPMSKLMEEKMQGRSLSWPGSTARVAVDAWKLGSAHVEEPRDIPGKKSPELGLKWIAIAEGGEIAVGSQEAERFKNRGGRLESLGKRSAEAYFEEARQQGRLPAAIIFPQSNAGGGALGEIRVGRESSLVDQERAEEELSELMREGAAEHARKDDPEQGSLGLAEISGIPTKAIARDSASQPVDGQASRAALGTAATLLASMSAAWMMAAARRRGRSGEFDVHAASPAKTWALALSMPAGWAMAYSAACAVGFGLSTIIFLGQIDARLAAQASLAMLIQSMAFACWGTLGLSFVLKKTFSKLAMLIPLMLILHVMREALVDAGGGPRGMISALMSNDIETWAIAAGSYASTAILAVALAHFKIGSGQRRIWQAKPLK